VIQQYQHSLFLLLSHSRTHNGYCSTHAQGEDDRVKRRVIMAIVKNIDGSFYFVLHVRSFAVGILRRCLAVATAKSGIASLAKSGSINCRHCAPIRVAESCSRIRGLATCSWPGWRNLWTETRRRQRHETEACCSGGPWQCAHAKGDQTTERDGADLLPWLPRIGWTHEW